MTRIRRIPAFIARPAFLARLVPVLFFLPALVLGIGLARPVAAQAVPLAEISRYLNGLTTLEADFVQANSDGTRSSGRLFIHRPGRVRFEYAPPDRTLVMAGGGQVAIFDPKSNQPPEQYPLARTPLSLILAPQVDLTRARMVVGHETDGTTTTVVAQDPQHPEYGTMRMVFSNAPLELRRWVITDEGGGQTVVVLDNLRKGGSIGASRFNINLETERRNQRR